MWRGSRCCKDALFHEGPCSVQLPERIRDRSEFISNMEALSSQLCPSLVPPRAAIEGAAVLELLLWLPCLLCLQHSLSSLLGSLQCVLSLGDLSVPVTLLSLCLSILGTFKPTQGCSSHASLHLEMMSPGAQLCHHCV